MWYGGAVTVKTMFFALLLLLSATITIAQANPDVIKVFTDPILLDESHFEHLVVDRKTDQIYIGAVNRIYKLSPDLEIVQSVITGPVNDSIDCTLEELYPCNFEKKLTDNVNKVLIIDYSTSRIITCGSVLQGICTIRDLNDISNNVHEVNEPIAANDVKLSTVAFIASGPPNPPLTQVMYVGVSFTGTSPYRTEIPAVSSRSLQDDRLLKTMRADETTGTYMYVNSLSRYRYPIDYVYGFSSEGFSYFLTTQLKSVGSDVYYSKVIRVCHDDENYYSYTEIPITCGVGGNHRYNLVQAAFVGKVGSILARELEMTTQNDVLFTVFSQSEAINSNKASDLSAVCVFPLKEIRQKFTQNIKSCFSGNGSRGLDFITPSQPCIRTRFPINEEYCGLDVNTPLGGDIPVEAEPVVVSAKRLTAVVATAKGDDTIVFLGTAEGRLRKAVIENASNAIEHGEIVVDNGSSVNKDLFFDPQAKHLYVMTERKLTKVKVA